MNKLNEQISRIKLIMGLTEASVDGSGNITNLEPNVFDEFPEDVLETLNQNYFYMFSNFDWNSKSSEFTNGGNYDGEGFNKWIEQHKQGEFIKNIDRIISAVRSDIILMKRKQLASKKLESFEELIKPVFGKNITGDALTKFEEEILMDPYATIESIERGFREAKNLIDQYGNIDSKKMEKSTFFSGGDINIPNFERFVKDNPQYKKTFDVWYKLFNEEMDLSLKNTYSHHIIGYDQLRKLYDFLITYRKTIR